MPSQCNASASRAAGAALPEHFSTSRDPFPSRISFLGCALATAIACQPSALPPPAATSPSAEVAPAAPSATLRVLSEDRELLLRPTTAAVRDGVAWVAIGQLGSLFGDGPPRVPFRALAFPLSESEQSPPGLELEGEDFYPEGVAAGRDGSLFIGSIRRGEVVRVAPGEVRGEVLVPASVTQRGVIGMTVDEKRELLWLCDSNPTLPEADKAGALVGVRLSDGQEVARHELPPKGEIPAFCNDVIVSPAGDLWITETMGGRLFRVPADDALEATTPVAFLDGGLIAPPDGGCCGANGLEWMAGKIVVANSGRGTLVAVDPESSDALSSTVEIPLQDDAGNRVTLCSPDGLARVPGSDELRMVLVENGGCESKAPRVSEITLTAW